MTVLHHSTPTDLFFCSKVKSMHVAMAQEVQAILNNQGDTIAKRDECHKMADANREYVHFRWGKF